MPGNTPKPPTSAKTQSSTTASPTKNQSAPSKPSSSKSTKAEKGEKGEKLTAKQKKVLEQKKKEEEEKQRKEEEERIRKEEEEERKRKEEEERKINEERRKKAEEEKKRLDEEKGSFDSEVIPSFKEKLHTLMIVAKEEDEWNKFVNCENLPKLDDDVDMNNFISSWRDLNELALKKEIRNINEDFAMVVEGCKVMNEIEYLLVESIAQSKKDLETHCTKYLNYLSNCIVQTMDDATAHIMQYFDKYLSSENDQYQKVHPFIKYGIWTNISKNLYVIFLISQ
ncbi:predicted protein [Naegleria gruberi]|uniref:Predicted protein n=1 Tax=Naegleria gruberi TaxID=5762 RepID=D2UXT0_NAEGR|nr:uncharacterized protein NAEGRDRAFT_61231 [Naegleria gruberi]EFC50681.1 predicted protein [Naegleria gruberi]|eukprot:XP_002683425.1 predicted protein [Naegleria gruberi strain NEG-M]